LKTQVHSKLLNSFMYVTVGTGIAFVECILKTEFCIMSCLSVNDLLGWLGEMYLWLSVLDTAVTPFLFIWSKL
jgi:hypothetical protein